MSAAPNRSAPAPNQQEAAVQLAAAGAAQAARAAQIKADIAKHERVLEKLRAQHLGKRGRYSSSDTNKKKTADEALKYLYEGCLLAEGRAAAAAQRRRLADESQAAIVSQSGAAHHAAPPDARQHYGFAAAGAAARAAAAPPAALDEQPPDANENDELPEDVDKRYFSAASAQTKFNVWAQNEARAGRGGENMGGGYWRYVPPHFVQLGGSASTVGVDPLVVYDPHRTYGCGHGACPLHKWDGTQRLKTAGLTSTCAPALEHESAPARPLISFN